FTIGGPIGALLGIALGNVAHRLAGNDEEPLIGTGGGSTQTHFRRSSTVDSTPADFHLSVLVLAAIVIKADGKVDEKELDFVRQSFVRMFGKQKANESFKVFNSIVKQQTNTKEVCFQIRRHTSHAMRLQLVHFLFQIGEADGHLHQSELHVIRTIASYLYIRSADFESIHAMFAKKTTKADYYTILEITQQATDDEVKKAYRKMAKKYHPDRLVDMGADVQAAAQEKFHKVQEAYDAICKERGI
ncbi:MAG: TerB family tellurite resistance protein, partial [Schleiferiaceae bacterium]|nr:TerB family tellurite resistance protein [Schleiferiaceae bacterium]